MKDKQLTNVHRLVHLFWISMGMFISYYASNLGIWSAAGPETGFFPLVSGLMLALGGVMSWVANDTAPISIPPKRQCLLLLLLVAGLAIIALTIDTLGFLIPSAVFVVTVIVATAPRRWRIALFWGPISTLAIYLVFSRIFNVPLPRGIVGF